MSQLVGQVAVITGAGSGIGRAIARALAGHGAAVALVGRRPEPLESLAAELGGAGIDARPFPADVSDEAEIGSLVDAVRRRFQRVDILVHSAAFFRPGVISEATLDDFDRHYRTNLRGPYQLTRDLLPDLRRCEGQVVFVNSSVGLQSRGGVGLYAATKHGLKAFADALREEVNRDRVRVLSVYPGRTATPTQSRLHETEQLAYSPERLLQPEDVASVVVNALCLPRTAEVTDISLRPLANTRH